MHYKWNQVDPQSAVILKWLMAVLCFSLFVHFWHSHPKLPLVLGLCIGVLLGWAIPPRPSLKQLAIMVIATLALGAALTILQR